MEQSRVPRVGPYLLTLPDQAPGSAGLLDMLPGMPTALAGRVAMWCGGLRLTYRELDERAERLARALEYWDLGRGARIAILARHCHRVVETRMAVARTGAILVPIEPDSSPRRAAGVLSETNARALFIGVEFLARLEQIAELARDVDALPVILTDRAPRGLFTYERLLEVAVAPTRQAVL